MASESQSSISIPPEIITDILCRLPAKSLGRFRCVSKDWLSLISEPRFIKTHQYTYNQMHLISVSYSIYSHPAPHHEPDSLLKPKKLRFESHNNYFTFHGSCNGLVLVLTHSFSGVHRIVVLNPTTMVFVDLPAHNLMVNESLDIEIMYGFGYDSLTDDYKVVTICYFHYNYLIPPDCMYVHVYSLRAKFWRRVMDSPYDHSYGWNMSGVFVNGFLHWIVKSGDLLPVIVAFSLADEKFSEVPSPDIRNDVDIISRNDCKLAVLDGKLAIFLESEVWLMNEYGVRVSWTRILVHGFNEFPPVEPMLLDENGKIVIVSCDRMYIYDIKIGAFCKSIELYRNVKVLKVSGTYVESLVSPAEFLGQRMRKSGKKAAF